MSHVSTRIKRLLVHNPHLSTDRLRAILKRQGLKMTGISIYQIRSTFLADLKLLKEMNMIDDRTRPSKPKPRYQYGSTNRSDAKRHPDEPGRKRFRPWRFSG